MHIPDGYLSPLAYLPLWGASAGVWAIALRKLRGSLTNRNVPYIAMAAAFCFLVQMFNVPVPGGATGHALGAGLAAILLGPWAAVITISIVLLIQAVMFGDGGITALGANTIGMAVIAPFVTFWVFSALNGPGPRRPIIAAFVAGYLGITASALYTAVLLGIQPLIAHSADGAALYAPYPLAVAVPVMAVEHLLFFSIIEGMMTALVYKYFLLHGGAEFSPISTLATPSTPSPSHPGRFKKRLWLGLALLALLTPIGVYLPELVGSGGAWGEWAPEALRELVGYVPRGMDKLAALWRAPVADYGQAEGVGGAAYALSALLGVVAVMAVVYALARGLRPGRGHRPARMAYLERGIEALASLIRGTYAQWELASASGLLQRMDARVKLVLWVSYLLLVSLMHGLAGQAMLMAGIFLLAASTGIGLWGYYKRVLALALFFGTLVALPSALNIITPGEVVLPLFTLDRPYDLWPLHIPQVVGISRPGLAGVATLTARVANSIALSFLVFYTTPFTEIVRALKVFKVPDAVVMTITLAYKYIFILARTVGEMHMAKKSRLLRAPGAGEARNWMAGRLAFVFARTRRRADEVLAAMLARGLGPGGMKLQAGAALAAKDKLLGAALLLPLAAWLAIKAKGLL